MHLYNFIEFEFQTMHYVHEIIVSINKERNGEMMREVPITRRCETRRNSAARTRARATRWGYNPRDAFSMFESVGRHSKYSLRGYLHNFWRKRRELLEYTRPRQTQVFNVANIKSHAYWRMNDLISNVISNMHLLNLTRVYRISITL